jgi:superfamily II DNA/RNA helicase
MYHLQPAVIAAPVATVAVNDCYSPLLISPGQPPGGAIRSLVLAPTRELAAQIKAEAEKLLQPLAKSVGVQVSVSGHVTEHVMTGRP